MSMTNYECDSCQRIIAGCNLDEGETCPYCGGNTREAYTTSGAWEDPDVEKRAYEAIYGKPKK